MKKRKLIYIMIAVLLVGYILINSEYVIKVKNNKIIYADVVDKESKRKGIFVSGKMNTILKAEDLVETINSPSLFYNVGEGEKVAVCLQEYKTIFSNKTKHRIRPILDENGFVVIETNYNRLPI